MKKLFVFAVVAVFLAFPLTAFGTMGQMSPASKDINVEFFGSMKTYPTWMSQLNFNDNTDVGDWMLDENGPMTDHSIRNELRMGWKGGNDSFDFMIILEADFSFDKNNTDRGGNKAGYTYEYVEDAGFSGESFGIEKLDVGYNFGPFRIHAGWDTRWLDLMTGCLVYADDHPYIGLNGNIGENFSWQADYYVHYDDMSRSTTIETNTALISGGTIKYEEPAINPWDGDSLDWRFYTIKGIYKIPSGFAKGFVISPFYAFSDNNDAQTNNAQVSYVGLEAYGKLGMFTPRFEVAYADGDTDDNAAGKDYDISAMAAYASVDVEICPGFIPYVGVRYMEGDDDPNDDDIDAYNAIGDAMRYTPTFGMENAILYRFVPTLNSFIYAGNFNMFGTAKGYGGTSNTSHGDAPGLMMWGLGFKGKFGNWSYKVQYMDFQFDEAPNVNKAGLAKDVDDEVGQEFDLRVAYEFSKHFTIANCFSAFDPGDAIEDYYGDDYDDTALVNTIELIWKW